VNFLIFLATALRWGGTKTVVTHWTFPPSQAGRAAT
jgi:hypothetical protein